MSDEEKRIVLGGDEAIALWREGRETWNRWVSKNPVADVVFTGVDFSKFREGHNLNIYFTGFNFPVGRVLFGHANFGDGDVHFDRAKFRDGDASFWNAKFGDGNVYFNGAKFGDGKVTFADAKFGEGTVFFNGTDFGNGKVFFDYANFGGGDVFFDDAKFGDGDVCFLSLECKAQFNFNNVSKIANADLRNASFARAVIINNVSFDGTLDLVNSKLTHQLSLHDVTCQLHRESIIFKKAKDKKDAERLNRLKELAENNKHHQLAMRYHADEQRASRWHYMSTVASLLDMVFSGICNYGQSILRPFLFWILSIVTFTKAYSALSSAFTHTTKDIWQMLMFSAANSIPFLTSARGAREKGIEQFFNIQDSLLFIYPLMMAQGVISIILLFLIGLGLRNRFRV